MMKKKKILIIGGTGFIGYHLALKCLKLNWSVVSLSFKNSKSSRRLKKVKYLYGDISNFKNLRVLLKYNFNYVVNLGGYIDHYNKLKTYKSHFLGLKNLARFFLKKKIDCFIQAGSSAEYGNVNSPQKETIICKPELIYGKSKLKSTKYLMKLYKKKNFPVTILRLYQVYGPYQKIDRFVPLLIKACLKNTQFLTSQGTQKRDFLYVDDVVSAIFKIFDNELSRGEIINIGKGKPIELLKIMKLVKKEIKGGKIILGKIKLRKDEPMIVYPNVKKAKDLLRWSFKTSLLTGLRKTINYYKKNL